MAHFRRLAPMMMAACLAAPAAGAEPWAETTLRGLTLAEKLGQLVLLSVHAGWTPAELESAREAVRTHRPGGVILYGAAPEEHARLVRELQAASPLPLLVALDAEWGPEMRLSGTVRFPRNLTLGAVADDGLIGRLGAEIGGQLRAAGVHMNLAPVVDVNNNPRNPVINERSFGEDPEAVARKGSAYMLGVQSAGVLACAKHFPGHGDTDVDSHLDLPRIPHQRERFERVELVPFRRLVDEGAAAVMTAHVAVPALEPDADRPASLSARVIDGLLRRELKFQGLVVSDALAMKAVSKTYPGGRAMAEAALAGTDLLLTGSDDGDVPRLLGQELPDGLRRLKEAVRSGALPEAELDRRVLRILRAKERLGLDRDRLLPAADLAARLDSPGGRELKAELYREAVTLARNDGGLLPLKPGQTIALVQIGSPPRLRRLRNRLPWFFRRSAYAPFAAALAGRLSFRAFYLPSEPDAKDAERLLGRLAGYDAVVVSLLGLTRKAAQRYGLSEEAVELLARLRSSGKPVALTVFGNPYSLASAGPQTAVLVAYEDDPDAQQAAAAVVSGERTAKGRLPVRASAEFPAGTGL